MRDYRPAMVNSLDFGAYATLLPKWFPKNKSGTKNFAPGICFYMIYVLDTTMSFLFSSDRQNQIVDKGFHFFIPVAERLHTAYGRLKPAAHSPPTLGYEFLPFANLPL